MVLVCYLYLLTKLTFYLLSLENKKLYKQGSIKPSENKLTLQLYKKGLNHVSLKHKD